MDNTERLISLYHTGFIVCVVLFVIGILLAVACFFMFDIRNIFMLRTGRAKQQTIAEMQARNQKTGKLSTSVPYTDSGSLKGPAPAEPAKRGKKSGALKSSPKRSVTIEPPKSSSKKQLGTELTASSDKTLLQGGEVKQMTGQTHMDPLETEVLKSSQKSAEPVNANPGFRFTITERTIVIHTTESI